MPRLGWVTGVKTHTARFVLITWPFQLLPDIISLEWPDRSLSRLAVYEGLRRAASAQLHQAMDTKGPNWRTRRQLGTHGQSFLGW